MALRKLFVLAAGVVICGVASGPSAWAEWDVDGLEELLPIEETEAERLLWQGREHERPDRARRSDPPPLAPVRNCAEWEPCTGVMIRYPLGLPYELLRDFDDDVTLHVVVSSGYHSSAQSAFAANGIDMAQVEWLVKPNDSIWTRDYGAWFVFDGNDGIAIIDHTYNRPYRPNDNMIPVHFGEQQGIPVHSHDMYHTGGNYMTDGAHISSSTRLVYQEAAAHNGMSQTDVDQLMLDYYGVETYHVLEYIEGGGIHHIDTWAKFLDEETVLVKEVWSSHHTYDTLDQRTTLLASLEASTGRTYQVHRVYCYNIGGGAPASYTNSLILNDKIYVPFFGNSTYDDAALAAYQNAAPGYAVEGYYYGGFLSDDALHCRAKGVVDRGMLRVAHIPIHDEQTGDVTVSAFVHDHSQTGISSVELHYRHDAGAWQTVSMLPTRRADYEAVILAPIADATTDYYIDAADNSGREAGMPRVEPATWYSFVQTVDPSSVPDARLRESVVLHGARPNPFGAQTAFSFELLFADRVELDVLDSEGRHVRTLVQGTCSAGMTRVAWDGKDDAGKEMPAGVYRFRLRAAGIEHVRPAVLVR